VMYRRVAFAACIATSACAGGSETGNPAPPTQIDLGIRTTDPNAVAVSNAAESTVIQEAWVAFGQPAFLADEECGLLDSYPHKGPTLIAADLAAPDVRVEVDVEPGAYCGMVVPIENKTRDLTGDTPAELRNHSIVVRGHRSDGVAFTLAFPEQDELELQALGSAGMFDVRPHEPLLLAFDVATWMDDVDLDHAELEDDGAILIDDAHNLPLLAIFEANIDCSLDLFEDTNGSGALETGDRRIARCSDE
jgi:hypothetical protein